MKRPLTYHLLLGAVVLIPTTHGGTRPPAHQAQPSGSKLALIVAIGAYDKATSGYDSISSTRDVPLVRGALLSQGFDSSAIRVIKDRDATKAGILAGLKWLEEMAKPGAVVVFHYSGHGQQITDVSGDEPDEMDEMLVPFGAPNFDKAPANYRGEMHLLDDELGVALDAIRRRVGPRGNVLFLIDACFSGSSTRGVEELPVRGIARPIIISGVPKRGGSRGSEKDRGSGIDPTGKTRGGDDPALSPFVVISATQFDELDHETLDDDQQSVGPLSYAISKVLPKVDAQSSYRDLFEQIRVKMSAMNLRRQEPQIEGMPDTRVFNGQAVAQPGYFKVTRVVDDTLVEVAAGSLLGVFPGTGIAFRLPPTGGGLGTLVDSGIVQIGADLASWVRMTNRVDRERLEQSRAYVTRYSYGDQRVRVALDQSLPRELSAQLQSSLSAISIIELSGNKPDLRLVALSTPARGARPEIATIASASNDTIATGISVDSLVDKIRAIARSRYFRNLEMKDPQGAIKLSMRLIASSRQHQKIGSQHILPEVKDSLPLDAKRSAGGLLLMSPEDFYWIEIRNEGMQPAYFTILDLQSDYSVSLLFPPLGQTMSDVQLAPGRSYRIPACCWATKPYGTEVLKLIATSEPVDFSSIVSPGIRRGGGASRNLLQQLLADGYSGTRSDGTAPAGQAATAEVTINVVPRSPTP